MKVHRRLLLMQWPTTQHKQPTAWLNTARSNGAADCVTMSENYYNKLTTNILKCDYVSSFMYSNYYYD